MTKQLKIGRLAFRQEGNWWNAYYALRQDSLDGAVQLGSLAMTVAATNPKAKQAFMDTMRIVVSGVIEDATGISPEWGGAHAAPESERSGNA